MGVYPVVWLELLETVGVLRIAKRYKSSGLIGTLTNLFEKFCMKVTRPWDSIYGLYEIPTVFGVGTNKEVAVG